MPPAGKDIWLQQPAPAHNGVYVACRLFGSHSLYETMHGENVAAIAAASDSRFYHRHRHDHPHRLKQPRGSLSGWNSQSAMCGKPAATANRHLHRICVCMHQPSANASVDRLKQRVRPLHSGVSVCMYDRLKQPDRIHEQIYDIFATSSRGVSNNHVVNTT